MPGISIRIWSLKTIRDDARHRIVRASTIQSIFFVSQLSISEHLHASCDSFHITEKAVKFKLGPTDEAFSLPLRNLVRVFFLGQKFMQRDLTDQQSTCTVGLLAHLPMCRGLDEWTKASKFIRLRS